MRGAIQVGRNFGAELIGQRLERDIRDELYAGLLGKSMTFHSLRPVGEIMARATSDVREINLMLNPGVNLVVGSGMFLVMPLLFSARYHLALTITPLLFIVAYAFALRRYRNCSACSAWPHPSRPPLPTTKSASSGEGGEAEQLPGIRQSRYGAHE